MLFYISQHRQTFFCIERGNDLNVRGAEFIELETVESGSRKTNCKVAEDMKFCIHIHRFYVDIRIHIHRCVFCLVLFLPSFAISHDGCM